MKRLPVLVAITLSATGFTKPQDMPDVKAADLPTQNAVCGFLQNNVSLSASDIWRARARCDLIAGFNIMLKDHPGPVDPRNRAFLAKAIPALKSSLSLAEKISSARGYRSVLKSYSATFKDGHYQLKGTKKLKSTVSSEAGAQSAGVLIGWREGRFSAFHAAPNSGVKTGDKLLSCDGLSADKLMHRNVFSISPYSAANPSNWAMNAAQLLADNGNPFVKLPKACRFMGLNGAYRIKLKWQPRAQNYSDLVLASQFGGVPKTGMKQIRDGIWWVNVSNFSPRTAIETARLKQLISDIRANREKLRSAKAIVFDTRGNNGGDSTWGNDILRALYAQDYFSYRTYRPKVTIDWRLNKELVRHIAFIREAIGVKQNNQRIIDWVDSVLPGMMTSLKAGKDFYSERSSTFKTAPKQTGNPVSAKVFLFTHGWCASSCLTFADNALAMQGVTQIGYYTGYDTTYMEVKHAALPSGFGRILVPLKVIRNRPRKSRQFYTPEKLFNNFNWNDQSVHKWFLRKVMAK